MPICAMIFWRLFAAEMFPPTGWLPQSRARILLWSPLVKGGEYAHQNAYKMCISERSASFHQPKEEEEEFNWNRLNLAVIGVLKPKRS